MCGVFLCFVKYNNKNQVVLSWKCPQTDSTADTQMSELRVIIVTWDVLQRSWLYIWMQMRMLPHGTHSLVPFHSQVLSLMSNPHSVSFSVSHTFPSAFLSSCPPVLPLLSLSAQADRKCQVRPGYFRPNWETDVPPETWHLDMPFILPHALPPKRQEPDMLTARRNTDNCPFWGLFQANQRQGWHWSDKQLHQGETANSQKDLSRNDCFW